MLNIRSTAEWGSTLRSCAMTCRAWFPRSRRHLFRCLSIHSKPSLLRLAAVLPTSDSPPSCHVSSLEGLEPESPQERPWLNRFGHLLPYYLKEKLPHASQLVLHDNSQAGYSDRGLRIYHPSFFPLLAHFHNVEDLTLRGYWFLYFDDLRRLLGALENLKRATLIDSGWKVRSSYVPPSPCFTPPSGSSLSSTSRGVIHLIWAYTFGYFLLYVPHLVVIVERITNPHIHV